tara:strand:+ start:403 stop:612 length:210 start_codon:yes stop_codon:yes gene_type:complete
MFNTADEDSYFEQDEIKPTDSEATPNSTSYYSGSSNRKQHHTSTQDHSKKPDAKMGSASTDTHVKYDEH